MTTAAADKPGYWQIAAGSLGRDYADSFVRYGMAFVGGKRKIATMAKVKAGDRMLLKRGLSEVIAVGRVVARDGKATGDLDKPWLRDFDGWDLSAYCYVEWHCPDKPYRTRGLTRATIRRANQGHLLELAEQVLRDVSARAGVSPEPAPTQGVDDAEILEFLIREGLRPSAAEDLTTAFRRIRLLARYYYRECKWEDIREHETRTFLILPLLLALGWPEQHLKIELAAGGKRVDVACFSRPYRRDANGHANDDDCALILESKGFSQGLDYAPKQAKGHAEHFQKCRAVVVSNGYCYKAYRREGDHTFSQTPSAYLNLLNPQDRYPLDPQNVMGCLKLLQLLLPSSGVRD